MKEQIISWWIKRERREKQLLVFVAILFVIMLLWFTIYQPIQREKSNAQQQVKRHQQALIWMQTHSAELKTLQKESNVIHNKTDSIESMIYQSAKKNQVTIQRLQPQGKQILAEIGGVTFSQLLDWFIQLEQQFNIKVMAIEINGDNKQSGLVQVKHLLLQGVNGD